MKNICSNTLNLTLLIELSLLSSCKKEGDNIIVENKCYVSIAYLANDDKPKEFSPILAYSCDTESLVQYYSPEFSNINVFRYEKNGERIIMLASDENLVIAPINNNGENIYILNAAEGLNTLFYGTFDGQFKLCGEIPLEIEETSTKSSYNYGDEYREIIKHGLFDKLASKGGKIGDAMSIATFGMCHAGDLFSSLSRLYSIIGTLGLANGAGSDYQEEAINSVEEYYTDIIKDISQKAILKLVPCGLQTIAGWTLKVCEFCISSFTDTDTISEEDMYVSQEEYITPVFYRIKSLSPLNNWEVVPEDRNPFLLDIKVSNIGETSALFSGTSSYGSSGFTHAQDAVIEQGYMYFKVKDGEKTYLPSEGMASKEVSLSKGTHYQAYAWVHTLAGKDWYSVAKSFYTRGAVLSFSPFSEMGLDHSGGVVSTNVIVSDGATWKIVGSPSWCSISINENAISVSVQKSSGDRDGRIDIETTSVYGEKTTASIYISQKQYNWDNTSWRVEGTYKWSDSSTSWPMKFEVTFRSISSPYTEGGHKYYINEQGQAVREYEEINPYYPNLKHVEIETYTRTGPTTARMVLTGYEQNPNPFTGEIISREAQGESLCSIINSNL